MRPMSAADARNGFRDDLRSLFAEAPWAVLRDAAGLVAFVMTVVAVLHIPSPV
jgi:hypothetical protein